MSRLHKNFDHALDRLGTYIYGIRDDTKMHL